MSQGDSGSKIDGSGSFPHAAFLICNCQDGGHKRPRHLCMGTSPPGWQPLHNSSNDPPSIPVAGPIRSPPDIDVANLLVPTWECKRKIVFLGSRRLVSVGVRGSAAATSELIACQLHLVASKVIIGEALEPLAQLFARGFFGDGTGDFRALQYFVLDKNRAVHTQSERQRVARP